MVRLGDRTPSGNIIDRRPQGPLSDRSRRAGFVVSVGFLTTLATGAIGVAVNGVNATLDYLGIERRIEASALAPARRVAIDDFAAIILADTERVWGEAFGRYGAAYDPPTLVFYDAQTTSSCGAILSAFGPVYCSDDARIYIDLGFFDSIADDFDVQGDFPPAYIIAHEVAHHVQRLTGDMDIFFDRLEAAEEPLNQLQVRFELQADCLAGVWTAKADAAFGLLEPGDIAEAVDAARTFGDDAMQRLRRGYVDEASFTHGAGEQRVQWFLRGRQQGDVAACDTWTQAYEAL